jgi:hypothetical protein
MKQLLVLLLLISLAMAQDVVVQEQQVWDNSVVVLAGKEATVALDYISSGDRIVGAFKTDGGEKINFFITKERARLEQPLDRQYYVNEYQFNATVPLVKDPETGENTPETTTYLLVFDNKAGSSDVTVHYRVKIEKSGEQNSSGGLFGRLRRT